MTVREFLLGVAVVAFALAALALWRAVSAARRRVRARKSRVSAGLILRGFLIVLLLAVGVASLRAAPPPDLANRPAPAPADAIVAFVQNARGDDSRTIQAVGARDGTARWTRRLSGNIESLHESTPDIILAHLEANDLFALRARDGVTLWRSSAGLDTFIEPLAADSARVYTVAPAAPARGTGALDVVALDALTGALAWREPLPPALGHARALAVGDGLLFVAGDVADASGARNQWEVAALATADGERRWAEAGAVLAGANMTVRALLVAGGNVIVEPGSGPLTALRERDGSLAWSGPSLPAGADPTTALNDAASDGTVVYVVAHAYADANGGITNFPVRLMALNASDGAALRTRALDQYLSAGRLALSDGVLLNGVSVNSAAVGYQGYNPNGSLLTAYDAAAGAPLWRDNAPPTGISWDFSPQMTPLGGNGVVYLLGIQADPYLQDRLSCAVFCPGVSWLYAVDVHTGVPWWRVRTGYVELTHLVY